MSDSRRVPATSAPTILAKLHRSIWELHDQEDFDSLQTAASRLYLELGWEAQKASQASELLTAAYQLADRAEAAGSRGGERTIYREAARKLRGVRRLFGRPPALGDLEVMWWWAFRHKQDITAFLLLFTSLLIVAANPVFAFRGTRHLRNASRLHSDRDWESVDFWLDQYWSAAKKTRSIPLAGGI